MRPAEILFSGALLLMTSVLPLHADLAATMATIESHQREGRFAEATALVQDALTAGVESLSAEDRLALRYELERTNRIAKDYSLTEERLREALKGPQGVRDVSDEEITRWIAQGYFDMITVEGEARFVNASRANLLFRHPEIRARAVKPSDGEFHRFLLEHTRAVRSEVKFPTQGTADPIPMEISFTLTVPPDQVPPGEVIRAWMPFPQQFTHQTGVQLLAAEPAVVQMAAPDYPMRSLYFEAPSAGSEPTVFSARYLVTLHPRRHELDASLVAATDQKAFRERDSWLGEQPPHVVFTTRITELAMKIVGQETNPMIRARKIYDWIAANKKYSYAREYSTIRCIPEYVLDNGYGDCGQIALTFITLCRAAGVPARWQSGWVVYPTWENLHDWTEIYLAPYGWIPVDADFAMGFEQDADLLTREEKDELKDFYFGGLDGFRLVINRDHGVPLFPAKEHFRSDNVDFQRGEVETKTGNLYYGQFRGQLRKTILGGPYSEIKSTRSDDSARPANPSAAR